MIQDIEQQAQVSFLGELTDRQAETEYQLAKLTPTRRRLRFVCVITAFAYLGAIYADSLVLSGSNFYLLLAGRCLAALIGLAPFLLSFNKNVSLSELGMAAGVYMSAVMACECLELYIKSDISIANGTPITAFIVLCFYLFQPPQIWQSLVAGGLGSLAYLATLVLVTNVSLGHSANTTLVFALANGFGLFYSIRFGASQRREFLALSELRRKAETDALTGLLNRRRVDELFEREYRAAKRNNHPCALLLMDIDHFKAINDSEGHAAGDAVLTALADRCARVLRLVDIFGRIGGEEFAVFMPHATPEQAQRTAERLRQAVGSTPFGINGKLLPVTVSIGGASLTSNIDNLERLYHQADDALYSAKRCGRDQVRF